MIIIKTKPLFGKKSSYSKHKSIKRFKINYIYYKISYLNINIKYKCSNKLVRTIKSYIYNEL